MGFPRKWNRRAGGGFTLTEVLGVVAVLAILAAIAVPGIITLRASLKFTELNDTARVLYSAAQNQMVELRAAGRMEELGGTAIAMPGDYEATASNPDWADVGGGFRVVTSGSAGAGVLFPAGSLDGVVAGNSYAVEYNVDTGMVYAVFYAEGTFTYSAALPRDADGRRAHDPMLGYYGGSATQTSTPDTVEAATATLINDDASLRLELTGLAEGTSYEIAVTQTGDARRVWTETLTPTYVGGLDYTLVLDSLETGRFAQTFPDLTPGADLNITITARKEGALPAVTYVTGNSLFASRAGSTVQIGCGRHLQNLAYTISKVEGGVTAAVQTADILWDATRHGAFTPIENSCLTSFDGGGHVIADLSVSAPTGGAGLFASLTPPVGGQPARVSNVRLTDPVVTTAAPYPAGTLAGSAANVTFTNCQVYATAGRYTAVSLTAAAGDPKPVGGLVGEAEGCTFLNCSASLPILRAGSATVGGLVGAAHNSAFTACYANSGYAQSADSEDWYGGVEGAATAGGFVGMGAGNTFTNCYAMGCLWGGGTAGGFLGYQDGETQNSFTRCYSAVLLSGESTYPFAHAGRFTNCWSLKGCGATRTDSAAALAYTALRFALYDNNGDTAWTPATADATHTYRRTGVLPLPKLTALEHHGDWPLPTEDYLLGYYEVYADGSYGWYITAGADTLRSDLDNDKTVVADGYALLTSEGEAGDTLTVTYSDGTQTLDRAGTVALEDGDYDTFLLEPDSPALTGSTAESGLWHRLTADGQDFWFIPDVAKAAVNGASAAPAAPGTLSLRTARQLYQVGQRAYSAVTFRQERDIDMADYSALSFTALRSIGGSSFTGTYDGGGHVITTHVGITAPSGQAGLFALVQGGTVKNLTFRADPDCATAPIISSAGNAANAGGLIGYLFAGQVENCASAGFAVSSARGYAGGLVGLTMFGSTVTNCAAVHYGEPSGAGVAGDSGVGGLVGSCEMGDRVSNCYAIATLSANSVSRWGGLVGSIGDGDTVSNSYAIAFTAAGDALTAPVGENAGGTVSGCYTAVAEEESGDGDNVLNYDELAVRTFSGFSAAAGSHAYADALAGSDYPFPAVVKNGSNSVVHYGDWPVQTLRSAHLAYYEVYEDGSKYTLGFQCQALGLNTLADSKTIVLDGYAVLFEESGGVSAARYNEDKSFLLPARLGTLLSTNKFSLEGSGNSGNVLSNGKLSFKNVGDYYLGLLDYTTVVDSAPDSGCWSTLTVTLGDASCTFSYNPHFAKSPVGVNVTLPAPTQPFSVRTERHLAQLSQRSEYWGLSFIQERDLTIGPKASSPPYATGYPGLSGTLDSRYRYPTKFIGNSSTPFTGVYDGGGKTLTGWSYAVSRDTTGAGLFGYGKNATWKNLTLEDFSVTTTTAILHQAGALVGCATNCTLENIIIEEATVKARAMAGAAAGFLDGGTVNALTVEECTVSAARLVGGAFGQVVSEAGRVALTDITVAESGVTSFMDTALPPAFPASNTHQTYGTGGVAGAVVLRGSSNNVAMTGIAVEDTEVTVARITTGAAYYAAGMVVGNADLIRGSFSLTDVTLDSDCTLSAKDGGETGWYGGLIGILQGRGAATLGGAVKMNGFALSFNPDTSPAATSIGGFLGAATAGNGTLTISLPSGSTWSGVKLTASAGGSYTGGFAGQIGAGVTLSGGSGFVLDLGSLEIKGDGGSTGGFVGLCAGSVTQLAVELDHQITLQSGAGGTVGGFAGLLSGSAEHCHAAGSATVMVPGTHSTAYVGGFVGTLIGRTTDCFAALNVKRGEYVGGFAGNAANAAVSRCYASGSVAGNSLWQGGNTNAGGFVGDAVNSGFDNCYAAGSVENQGNSRYGGGFVGWMNGGSVLSCYSVGTVSVSFVQAVVNWEDNFGGFVGEVAAGSSVFPDENEVRELQAFYDLLDEVPVVNRAASHADKDPRTGAYTQSSLNNCMTVWEYLRTDHDLNCDSGVVVAALKAGGFADYPDVVGQWNENGYYRSPGTLAYNLYEALMDAGLSDLAQDTVWRLSWDEENDEPVIYWTAVPYEALFSGRQVAVYRYSRTGGFAVGACAVAAADQTSFGLSYFYMDITGDFQGHKLPEAVYLYTRGGANNNWGDYGEHGDSIARWLAGDFNQTKVSATFPDMRLVSGSGYNYPMLPGVGCGVGAEEYRHVRPGS